MENKANVLDELTRRAATTFLSNIPLTLKEACENCNKNVPDSASSLFGQSTSASGDYDGNLLAVGPTTFKSKSHHAYHRSVSSTVEFAVPKGLARQRQLSLAEVSPVRFVASSGDAGNVTPTKHAIVRKMKFVNEKMLLSNSAIAGENAKHILVSRKEHQSLPDVTDVGSLYNTNQVVSYHFLLDPSKPDPVVKLDCAEWMSGKHRTVLALNSYMVSIIGYTKPSELKRDLNLQFKASFPAVNITLSKLRSLERQMHRTAKMYGMQTGVLSCAKSYFERLVFSSVVNKPNRQHVAAACLLLAAKVHGDLNSQEVVQLVSTLEHSFKSTKTSFLCMEFQVFAALKFSLLPSQRARNISGDL